MNLYFCIVFFKRGQGWSLAVAVSIMSDTESCGGGFDVGAVGLYVTGCGGSSDGLESDSVVGHGDV